MSFLKNVEGLRIKLMALGLYIIPTSFMLTWMHRCAKDARSLYIITAMLPTVIPLMLTVGVFTAYRTIYIRRRSDTLEKTKENNYEASLKVIKKAVAWERFALPLSLLNFLIAFIGSFLITQDWISSSSLTPPGFYPGAFEVPFQFGNEPITFPATLFYSGWMGFGLYLLESTRRRFLSENLVPGYYLSLAFKFLYVTFTIPLVYIFLKIPGEFFFPNLTQETIQRPATLLVISVMVGFFPNEWISYIASSFRGKIGITVTQSLPLSTIQGIDYTMEALLYEDNIDSIQTLASEPIEKLSNITKIDRNTISEWKKQAILLNVFNDQKTVDRLSRLGINDITDVEILKEQVDLTKKITEEKVINLLSETDKDKLRENNDYWAFIIRLLLKEFDDYNTSSI